MSAPGASAPDELPIDVDLIKVLASDSRRDILRMLGERRKTLTELAEALGLKKATVLEHLQKLVAAGLIKKLDEDDRLWIYYELTPRGKRLVRPERTRFYLILGGTAAAALLLGIVVAASVLLGGAPQAFQSSEETAGSDALQSGKAFDARDLDAPQTAWRGLDEQVDLRIAEATSDATLVLRGPDGVSRSLPLVENVASLGATELDALPVGDHAFVLSSPVGEVELPQYLRVRDPVAAIFPRVVTEGENATLEVALVPPGLPPPANATVLLGETEHRLFGQSVAFLPLNATSDLAVKVGRSLESGIETLPALDVTLAPNGSALTIHVADRAAPLADAALFLDGALLGRSDANGSLAAEWPAPGDRALRIVAPDGRAREHAIRFGDQSATILAPQLRIEAFDARLPGSEGLRVRADVFNDGPADALVTLAAREGDALLASEIARVPAHGRAEVLLASHLATPQVLDVTAHAASGAYEQLVLRNMGGGATTNATAASESPQSAESAPPAAPGSFDADHADGKAALVDDAYAYRAYPATATVVARDTVVLSQLAATPAAEGMRASDQGAAVPGLAPLALVLAVALVAAALSRKRR